MFRVKRVLSRPGKSKNASAGFTPTASLKYLQLLFAQALTHIRALSLRTLPVARRLAEQPVSKRTIKFAKRYSAQLSFAVLVTVFLTVAVGEGQAYDLQAPTLAAQLEAGTNGFIGKPEIFSGQTILTGEIQQNVAIVYRVEKGDSMTAIASRYSLSVGTILDANNISAVNAEKVQPGTELVIPAVDTNTSLAWLDAINKAKEDERIRAEAERQRQLALQRRNTTSQNSRTSVSFASGSHSIIGRMWGQYNGGYPGQCTWYAYYKRPDLPARMGNGGQYLANARAKGLATGSVARPGALFVSSESGYGHVGYVESVSGGMMTVTEMNYAGTGVISRRTIPTNFYALKGFVY